MKNFFNREWSLPEKRLSIVSAFLFGCVLGFLFSPIKKGVYCGNHNGNRNESLPEKGTKGIL
ncbi:hypothetical protein [Lacrimispora sp.]|uniref:hypothetical protein n=1 Tax=Lacrimispora sp. TaxID=2719234 RepID=UPI002897DEE1|nr:hypothetical protein [Lacrimispora sp.]